MEPRPSCSCWQNDEDRSFDDKIGWSERGDGTEEQDERENPSQRGKLFFPWITEAINEGERVCLCVKGGDGRSKVVRSTEKEKRKRRERE